MKFKTMKEELKTHTNAHNRKKLKLNVELNDL